MKSDVLTLLANGLPVREFSLASRPLEVGRHPSCDVVVAAPDVSERVCFVERAHGSVFVRAVVSGGLARRVTLPLGHDLALGARHALRRGRREVTASAVERASSPRDPLTLISPRGRRFSLLAPLTVGSSPRNDVVIDDPNVDAFHCRLEPTYEGTVFVRDLGSRDGVWLGGARIANAEMRGGRLTIGRHEITLTASRDNRIVHRSDAMLNVMAKIEAAARVRWPVLITGESGVGKELVANEVHRLGAKSAGPFVTINAGALAPQLLESELFGHERGAFTGAVSQYRGAFERADGGTLFLDEVGELSLDAQRRLLRVLETWSIRRVGGETERAVQLRLICATHRDLVEMVSRGEFREDLYYRIHQLKIAVPPLRQRPRDITPLADSLLQQISDQLGARELHPDAVTALLRHRWPGNVRELRNVLRGAAARCEGRVIRLQHIEEAIGPRVKRTPGSYALHEVVERYNGNVSAAARALGIPRSTLRDHLRRQPRPGVG